MKTRKIVVLDAASLGDDLDLTLFEAFGDLTVYRETDSANAADHLRDADIAILNKVRLTAEILAAVPSLRLICEAATGYDNIDIPYCRAHGVAVCNVVGYSTQCVAQLTVSMALSLVTRLREFGDYVRSGAYTASGIPNRLTPVFHEIAGKTWGIIGYGNIGKQVAKVADALGCRVIVNRRNPMASSERECVTLDDICRRSDILSIHTPLNESTRNLLDREHIAMLRKDAIVINVARGAVTDEHALAEALEQGNLGGIGVDVYTQEPFSVDHPFNRIKNFPNVLLTPHMAWGGYETRVRLMSEMVENIRSFLGNIPRNRVDLL